MLQLRPRSCSWACSALAVAFLVLGSATTTVHAATDDQNLTGLVYLSDGTPLTATIWANNTSFVVYVNHDGNWSTARRYPAAPAWYLTSGGAYSIVLPASAKDVSWGSGDLYRVDFDVSAITGVPGSTDNATSHGTGDPGEFSPPGATDNVIVWTPTDNWQRWDVVMLAPTRPDYAPTQLQPATPVRKGLSSAVTFSMQVVNQGNATPVNPSTLAFYNASSPAAPFATFGIPPLAPAATSTRFAASWTSPAAPGTYSVVADVDYNDDILEWNETNNRFVWSIDVLAGPVTSLVVGAPNVTTGATYVTSATPFSFSVLDQSGVGIRNTTYRLDGGPWVNYTATGLFTLAGEGVHVVRWYSEDFAGNVEPITNATLRVDDTPPTTSLSVGVPKSFVGGTFVVGSTHILLSAMDGGVTPVGVRSMSFRIWSGMWAAWAPYGSPFTLSGADGTRYLEYRSQDHLGNQEAVRNTTLVLDDTPPTTTLSPASGPYTTAMTFSLSATDTGCGVNLTEVRIDAGPWTPYAGSFTLDPGDHTVSYRSTDRLGNPEPERARAVRVEGPPPPVTTNLKPIVAAVFATVLVLVGAWSARRSPWPTGSRRKLRAFLFAAAPFIIAEGATGVVSQITGILAIPPLMGIGTAVDLAILVAGIAVSVYRVRAAKPMM